MSVSDVEAFLNYFKLEYVLEFRLHSEIQFDFSRFRDQKANNLTGECFLFLKSRMQIKIIFLIHVTWISLTLQFSLNFSLC
jgi:hypothetical protein